MAHLRLGTRGREIAVPTPVFTAWAVVAAFGTYFCMYGFRKPFTAAGYEGVAGGDVSDKAFFVAAQVLGYTLSKFLGIKFVAEITPQRRMVAILLLIAWAEAALLAFAVVPAPWNAACLFANGLPLGMVFGMVLGVLEGRVMTELLAAGLCASFIVADGFTKSVGSWLLGAGVSEAWMPAVAGLLFAPALVVFVAMLGCVPPPDGRDVAARSERQPMLAADRRAFFKRYAPGLLGVMGMYLVVTVLRSIRADFAREIWIGLGYGEHPERFTTSEIMVGLGVMALTGLSVLVRDNRRAFFSAMAVSMLGLLLIPAVLVGRGYGLDGFSFMVLVGLGLYLPYVAVHTTIFERLIAMTGDRANIGFLMYLTDAFGYLGYITVMLGHRAFAAEGSGAAGAGLLGFFEAACWAMSAVGVVCLLVCWMYFARYTSPTTEPSVDGYSQVAASPAEA